MEQKTVNGIKYQSTGEWHEITHNPARDDEDMQAGFKDVTGTWHSLDNYIKTSNSSWNNEPYHHAAGLHARDITQYYKPEYIELDECCESVKVWQEVEA